MAKVNSIHCGEKTEPDPTWERVRACLLDLRDGGSASVDAGDDTWLIVLHIAELGYLVTGCGEGERDYFTLIERSLGDDPVTAFDGGNTNEYPRYSFVSKPVMLGALATFYATGQRDREYEWVPEEDAVY